MKAKKTLVSLLCASMIGFNANSVLANPEKSNKSNVSLVRQIKPQTYNFDEFFQEKFQPQNSIEDLISYTYSKYNHLVKNVKISYPDITLEELVNSANFWDKIRFGWLLFVDYSGNLNRLGYEFKKVDIKSDNLKILLFDRKKYERRDVPPYLKVDIDVGSLPDYMNVDEIKVFLEGNELYISKTENGKFFYSILRYRKS